MILDKLNNIKRYRSLTELEKIPLNDFKEGKFTLEENEIFGIGLTYETKDKDECLWEAHKKYIDVHVVLEGEEMVYINDIQNMTPTTEYDKENDYTLFKGNESETVLLKKGMFLCLYPNEVHKTAVKNDTPSSIKKIVFKIPYS